MHKRALQSLRRTFMSLSSLPQPYFDFKKKQLIYKLVFYQKMMGEEFMHVSGLTPP